MNPSAPSTETRQDEPTPYEPPRITWEERVDMVSIAVACAKNPGFPPEVCDGSPGPS
jgi:hypothetical protein